MPVPPQFRKAAGRRIKAPVPTNKAGGSKKVATFRNPGNKAGKGLFQQASAPDSAAGEGPAGPAGILGALMNAPAKKKKTKVQPAASRRLAAMKLAAQK